MRRIARALVVAFSAIAWLGTAAMAQQTVAAPIEPAPSGGRRIAITVDDLPVITTTTDPVVWADVTRGLVATFERHDIPAIGFVNESKLAGAGGAPDPSRVALLERWLDAGLELGNHGFAHLDLHRVPIAEYEADVLRGESLLRPLLARRGTAPRFFRHPFLHTGLDIETRDRFTSFLAAHGYRVAPVTVDNSDWIFARAYDNALDARPARVASDPAAAAHASRVAEAYGPYLESMVEFYEGQARAIVGREIPLVLLVHANRLNADHLDDVAKRLRSRG